MPTKRAKRRRTTQADTAGRTRRPPVDTAERPPKPPQGPPEALVVAPAPLPAAIYLPVRELAPWVGNPRKNDRAVDRVVASLRRFGFGAPVVARLANKEIIAGHTRVKAAIKLGMELVPVRLLDISAEDAHALALADNKLGELAAWDDLALAEALQALLDAKVDLSDTGFAEHEILKLLAQADAGDADEGPALETEPEKLQKKWKTALGQIWEIPSLATKGGVHRLACGSSTDPATVAALMAGERAAMMWTDPPYGVSYIGKTSQELKIQNDAKTPEALGAFLLEAFRTATDHLVPGAAFYVSAPAGPIYLQFMLAVNGAGWIFRQGLVWVKDVLVLGHADYHYKHEPLLFGYTPGGAAGGRGRGRTGWHGGNAETSVFEIKSPTAMHTPGAQRVERNLHPTLKPAELVARMVRNSSTRGGIVYEPFSGSGTTMVACETTGRLARSIELDPKYVAVALERMSERGCIGKARTP